MTNEAMNAFCRLAAIVTDTLREIAILQRRGPSRFRRLAALIFSELIAIMSMMVRQAAAADRVHRGAKDSRGTTRLLRPPEAWAAP